MSGGRKDSEEVIVGPYELPCFPDRKPTKHRALHASVKRGGFWGERAMLWLGGFGFTATKRTTANLRAELHERVTADLQHQRDEAAKRVKYFDALLRRWNDDPEQFAVEASK